jgi:hypothetical protein
MAAGPGHKLRFPGGKINAHSRLPSAGTAEHSCSSASRQPC